MQLFQLIRYGSFLLIGIAFAKLQVPKEDISTYESFLWLVGFFSFFWIAGNINVLLTLYPKKSEEEKKELLFNTFCILSFLSVVAAIILYPFSELGAIYLVFNNVAYLTEYILFLNNKKKTLLYYGISVALVQVLLCVLPIYLGYGISLSILALIYVALFKALYLLYLLQKFSRFHFNKEMVRHSIQLALPLLVSFFISGSAEYIDGWIVKSQFSLADFSVFRFGSREFPLFTILASTLSMSLIPAVAKDKKQGIATIYEQSKKYMHYFFPIAIVLTICSKWIFIVAFSSAFEESGKLFAALLLLTIPRLVFPQTILTALQKNKWILFASISEMLVNIIASILLAKQFGLIGVAYGTVLAFVFEKLLLTIILYKEEKIKPQQYIPLRTLFIYSLLLVLSFAASTLILN